MKQKTIKLTATDAYRAGLGALSDIHTGDRFTLIEHCHENTGATWFELLPESAGGVPGNMNANEKRYHGWRGTTNGWIATAHGLREVIKTTPIEHGDTDDYIKITLGNDLHPDWP